MPHESLPIISELKLVYENSDRHSERPKIVCSKDAYNVFRSTWSGQMNIVEEFKIMMLDNANCVLGTSLIAKGGFSSVMVDSKVAFATALLAKASSIILAHNHPSGNIKPSQADIRLTQKFFVAGKALDLPVLDHVILISEGAYYSFADEGIMPA